MERPMPQEVYRHFKGNLYQVLTIAIHSETREELVVYQALYGDFKVYCRPLDMFMSDVDRVKYPDVKQKKRFEKVDRASLVSAKPQAETVKPAISNAEPAESEDRVVRPMPLEPAAAEPVKSEQTIKTSDVMSKTTDEEARELNMNPLVIEFMDADLAVDKSAILSRLKPVITNDMIDIMALSLDVVVKDGDVYDRYNDLMTCLSAREKFESTRLRS